MGDSEPLYATVRRQNKVIGSNCSNSMSSCAVLTREERLVLALEARYGGREVANAAAAAIQRWYRGARLQRSFSRLMELAQSSDRLDRRLSLLGPDPPAQIGGFDVERNSFRTLPTADPAASARQLRSVEEDIDRLIVEAAGLMKSVGGSNNNRGGPSARHIKNRRTGGGGNLRRSSSMRATPTSSSECLEGGSPGSSRSRDDLEVPPPCPPLRGEAVYNGEPIYVTRDALYVKEGTFPEDGFEAADSAARAAAMPPRPPQRTVSFLAGDTLPRKVSHAAANQEMARPSHPQHPRILSDSDLHHPRPQQQPPMEAGSAGNLNHHQRAMSYQMEQHSRCHSSPAPLGPPAALDSSGDSGHALPPPPYVSPPPPGPPRAVYQEEVEEEDHFIDVLPPPPTEDPFPPPPPPAQLVVVQPRPPCDSSSSSSSSIDSGYGRSSVGDAGANNNNHVAASDAVFEPRPQFSHLMPNQQQQQQLQLQHQQQQSLQIHRNAVQPAMHRSSGSRITVTDIYGHILGNKASNLAGEDSPRAKKTVRIRTPDAVEESRQNLENQQQLQQQQQQLSQQQQLVHQQSQQMLQKASSVSLVDEDVFRRRQYRVGLNLFNQSPDVGMEYLLKKGFLDYSPLAAARFLRGRKGLSRKTVGEFLCDLRRPFNLAALHCFIHELDFTGLHLDIALRQLQEEVTLPGEAQKIEKMVEVFAKRYIQCNQMFVSSFRSPDTLFVLSYAVVLLNTDLHTRAVSKHARRMRREDFVRNLRGADAGADLDRDMLEGIYDRIRRQEFRPGSDHVTQVAKVEESLANRGKHFQPLAEPQRRLVCFCRLSEVPDPAKKRDKRHPHQRGVFLFNDLLVVTKTLAGKKGRTVHQYRSRVGLSDVRVGVFSSGDYPHGIRLTRRAAAGPGGEASVLATFDARSQSDQQRLVADLQESVAETLEMEKARMFLNSLPPAANGGTAAAAGVEDGMYGRACLRKLPVNEESLMMAPESFC